MDLPYILNITRIGPDYLLTHLSTGIPYLTLMGFFMLTGTTGNILVIAAISTTKGLRTAGNMFIFNLALADMCVTGIVDPFSIIVTNLLVLALWWLVGQVLKATYTYTADTIVYGSGCYRIIEAIMKGYVQGEIYFEARPGLCEFVASICLTSCFCSLLSIGAISVNRYVHICHNDRYRRIYSVRNTVFYTIGLWIASFLLEMSNFFGWGDHVYDRKTLSCIYDRTADYSYTLFFCLFGIGAPLLIITACYIRMFYYVYRAKKRILENKNGTALKLKGQTRESLKFVRTLCLIFVIFVVSWTPYVVVVLYDRYDVLSPEIHTYAVLVAHINSSLNSVMYGVTNRQFRRAYARVSGFNRCFKGAVVVPGGQAMATGLSMNNTSRRNDAQFFATVVDGETIA